jgi:uncharacterized membrane protein
MRRIGFVWLVVASCGVLVLVAIALNIAQHTPLGLHRWRETTWVIHGALLGWVLTGARWRPERGLQRRVAAIFGSQRFLPALMSTTLVIYFLTSVTHHLAFQTFSHDFTMIDDALYNTHEGRFLYSTVLGRSFLSEHFSPILLLLVPLHAVFSTPWFLVLVQPLALWTAAWILKRILDEQGMTPALRNVSILVYLSHPATIATLSYLFHMECFLPLCVFAIFLFYRRKQRVSFALMCLLALTIKEDVGIYLAGMGLWLALGERWWRGGTALVVGSLAWTLLAALDWIPHFGTGAQGYPFLARWQAWGDSPASIVSGYIQDPWRLLESLFRDPIPRYLACLGFLPFLHPAAILLFAAPWVINTTSGGIQQASLSLYYGMPFLTFAILASAVAMQSTRFERLCRQRGSLAVGWVVVMLNVAHYTFPEVPLDRFRVIGQIGAIPQQATVQAMSCFYPVLEYSQPKELLQADADHHANLHADYVLLRREGGTWPFSPSQIEATLAEARRRGYDAIYLSDGFAILQREGTVD